MHHFAQAVKFTLDPRTVDITVALQVNLVLHCSCSATLNHMTSSSSADGIYCIYIFLKSLMENKGWEEFSDAMEKDSGLASSRVWLTVWCLEKRKQGLINADQD